MHNVVTGPTLRSQEVCMICTHSLDACMITYVEQSWLEESLAQGLHLSLFNAKNVWIQFKSSG